MKKFIQVPWLCSRADIYSMLPPSASITASIQIRNWEHVFFHKRRQELGESSVDGGSQAGFGVGDVLDVWPNEVVHRIQTGREEGPDRLD